MLKISVVLMVAGLLLAFYSFFVPVYHDIQGHDDELREIERSLYEDTYEDEFGEPTPLKEYHFDLASRRYSELKRKYLSSRYVLFDYGVTLACLGGFFSVLGVVGWRTIRSPSRRLYTALIGLLAVFAMITALVFSLLLGFGRSSSPPWADSVGIPLFGIIYLAPVVVVLWLFHCLILMDPYSNSVRFCDIRFKLGTVWPLFVSLILIALLLLGSAGGEFILIFPTLLLLYSFLSLAAGRSSVSVVD